MSTHGNDSCVLALFAVFVLGGCSADDGQEGSKASGGTTMRTPTAGTGNFTASGGRAAGAGTSSYVSAGTAGTSPAVGTGGVAGLAGTAGTGGRFVAPTAGGAGLPTGGGAGTGGSGGTEIPTDPQCASVRPAEGASCDARGPVVCPAGTMQCVCVPLRDVPAWRCVDLGADSNGFGGASIGIDFGGSGGPGFGAGTGGTFGIAGREGSSFGGIRTEFQF